MSFPPLGPTLLTLIKQTDYKGLCVNEVKQIVRGVCKGLFHMHKNGVIHTDLKPENVLTNQPPTAPNAPSCSSSVRSTRTKSSNKQAHSTSSPLPQSDSQSGQTIAQIEALINDPKTPASDKKKLRKKLKKKKQKLKAKTKKLKSPDDAGGAQAAIEEAAMQVRQRGVATRTNAAHTRAPPIRMCEQRGRRGENALRAARTRYGRLKKRHSLTHRVRRPKRLRATLTRHSLAQAYFLQGLATGERPHHRTTSLCSHMCMGAWPTNPPVPPGRRGKSPASLPFSAAHLYPSRLPPHPRFPAPPPRRASLYLRRELPHAPYAPFPQRARARARPLHHLDFI